MCDLTYIVMNGEGNGQTEDLPETGDQSTQPQEVISMLGTSRKTI